MNNQFNYVKDDSKYVYGKAERWPAEKLLVRDINDMHRNYPDFKMKLLGTSGVTGEWFPMFLTQCHFKLASKEAVETCLIALKESDELIRRRKGALWTWQMAWEKGTEIMFFVNWFDTAFFFKYHEIFLGKDHSRYALDFGLDVREMSFVQYRILENGDKEKFEFSKLTEVEKEIFNHLDQIEFSREYKEARF